jgi:GNAT superfamily N-acetyltransferase
VNDDDTRALWELRHFSGELLKLADVLPAGLTAMLRSYHSELFTSPRWRWAGIGDPVGYESMAHRIARSVTDREWADGEPLDDPARNRHALAETPANFHRALRLLTARGEIVIRHGRYCTRPPDDRS